MTARLRSTPLAFRVTVMILGVAIALCHNFMHLPQSLHYVLYFVGLTIFLTFWSVSRSPRS